MKTSPTASKELCPKMLGQNQHFGAAAGPGHGVQWQPRVSLGYEVVARGVADTALVHFVPSFRCSEALQQSWFPSREERLQSPG